MATGWGGIWEDRFSSGFRRQTLTCAARRHGPLGIHFSNVAVNLVDCAHMPFCEAD